MTTYKIKSAVLSFAITFGLTAATMVATSVPVYAAPAPGTSRIVNAADLNLTTARGQSELQKRIARAAERVCVDPHERMLTTQLLGRKCIAATIEQASAQVEYAVQRDHAERQSASLVYPSQP